jgi:hypothetical protein
MTQSSLNCHIITICEIYLADRQRELRKKSAKHIVIILEKKTPRIVLRIKKVQSAVSDLFFVLNSMRYCTAKSWSQIQGPTHENGPDSELSANVRDLVRTRYLIILMLMCSRVSIKTLPFANSGWNNVQD